MVGEEERAYCKEERRRLNGAFKVVWSKVSLGVIKSWPVLWLVVSVCWGGRGQLLASPSIAALVKHPCIGH